MAQTSVFESPIAESQTEVCATVNRARRPYRYGSLRFKLDRSTDTVWRDGETVRRGACDTKAFIAAALTALESMDITKLRKPLALVFTADEEIGCLGAKRLAEAKPFTAKHAIVGEPTSLQPMRAGKGYCLAHVTVRGREAHSAYPQLGASAIFRAAKLIEKIEAIAEEVNIDTARGLIRHTQLLMSVSSRR